MTTDTNVVARYHGTESLSDLHKQGLQPENSNTEYKCSLMLKFI